MKEKLSFFIFGSLVGILVSAVAFSTWLFAGVSSGSHTRVLKLAHGLDAAHPVHIAMEKMGKRVAELSGGALSIDIYCGGALGSETKCIEQLKNGSLDMTKASSAQIGTFVPMMHALTLPYQYRDSGHYWRVLDSAVGKKFLGFMETEGLVGLCFYDAGARSFYTTKKIVKTPEDLSGMKIRVMTSRADMEMVKSFGASPTPVSAGETYTALAQGVVDGAENNPPTYFTSAHFEVAPHFTLDEHTRIPDVLIIGKKTWETLSPSQREIIRKAAAESSQFQRELWKKKTEDTMAQLAKRGIKPVDVDKNAFAQKARAVYKTYEGTEIGKLSEEIRGVK